ncbi:nitroreductase family protein [Marisediminicola sp. LYQ134]|uniref:nitroreductase family protein n=1 Tax=Marisediminicola sp. LYQ134 TaxID=3391061 RepID=UPI00398341F2
MSSLAPLRQHGSADPTAATPAASRSAETSTPLHPVLAERWSPRAFDSTVEIDEQTLTAALEAARWAPSAGNSQPWRFIVARRGTEAFGAVMQTLVGFNAEWAGAAGALVVAVADTLDAAGQPAVWSHYDVGQAVAHFTVQAHSDGVHVHQIGGFDRSRVSAAFALDDRFEPLTVIAVGSLGSPDALPERARAREGAPRTRLALADILIADI